MSFVRHILLLWKLFSYFHFDKEILTINGAILYQICVKNFVDTGDLVLVRLRHFMFKFQQRNTLLHERYSTFKNKVTQSYKTQITKTSSISSFLSLLQKNPFQNAINLTTHVQYLLYSFTLNTMNCHIKWRQVLNTFNFRGNWTKQKQII